MNIPNWCYNNVIVECVDESAAQSFYKGLKDIQESNQNNWIGNYLPSIGIDPEKLYCRTFISDIVEPIEESTVQMYLESAWSVPKEVFNALVDNDSRITHICYLSEEPGMEIYVKHDPENKYFSLTNIVVDLSCEHFTDIEYFKDAEEAIRFIENNTGVIKKDSESDSEYYERVNDILTEKNGDWYLFVHEFEIV